MRLKDIKSGSFVYSYWLGWIDFSLLALNFPPAPARRGRLFNQAVVIITQRGRCICKKENSLLILKHQVYFLRNYLPNGRNVYTEVTVEVNEFHLKKLNRNFVEIRSWNTSTGVIKWSWDKHRLNINKITFSSNLCNFFSCTYLEDVF